MYALEKNYMLYEVFGKRDIVHFFLFVYVAMPFIAVWIAKFWVEHWLLCLWDVLLYFKFSDLKSQKLSIKNLIFSV